MEHPIIPYARTAWATGAAEVPGASLSESSCEAAVAAAIEHADDPEILERVRKTARLDATYQVIQRRHDELEERWHAKLKMILDRVGRKISTRVAHAVIAHKGTETKTDEERIVQQSLAALVGTELWIEWVNLMQEAEMEGLAEGQVAAMAYLVQASASPFPDFEAEYSQVLANLRELGPDWGNVETWMGKMSQGTAYQLGNDLAAAIESGATYDELVSLVEDNIGLDRVGAALLFDNFLASSVTDGEISFYQSEGVLQVDILNAENPCEECESDSIYGPYDVGDAPDVPVHFNCRCTVIPSRGS